MFGWLRELLDVRYEWNKRKLELVEKNIEITPAANDEVICDSCETLREQLSIANQEKKLLLERLLDPGIKAERTIDTSNLKPLIPQVNRRWADTRRLLEENDRAKARAARENEEVNRLNKTDKISTEELEADLIAMEQPKTGTEGEKHGS